MHKKMTQIRFLTFSAQLTPSSKTDISALYFHFKQKPNLWAAGNGQSTL
jgi:hypothetical protein